MRKTLANQAMDYFVICSLLGIVWGGGYVTIAVYSRSNQVHSDTEALFRIGTLVFFSTTVLAIVRINQLSFWHKIESLTGSIAEEAKMTARLATSSFAGMFAASTSVANLLTRPDHTLFSTSGDSLMVIGELCLIIMFSDRRADLKKLEEQPPAPESSSVA